MGIWAHAGIGLDGCGRRGTHSVLHLDSMPTSKLKFTAWHSGADTQLGLRPHSGSLRLYGTMASSAGGRVAVEGHAKAKYGEDGNPVPAANAA